MQTYIYVGLDTLESRMVADSYYLSSYSKPLTALVIPEILENFLVMLRIFFGLILNSFNTGKLPSFTSNPHYLYL